MMHTCQMLFLVTGRCNLSCPHCAQSNWRMDYHDYHMTPKELTAMGRRIREYGLHYQWAQIMGGEPAFWTHLEDGCMAIRQTKAFDGIEIFSNCYEPEPLINILENGLADRIVTQTVNASRRGIEAINLKFPGRVIVTPQPFHKVHPKAPMKDVLPALCGCNFITVFDWKVWPCPGIYQHMRQLDLDMEHPPVWTHIEGNWWKKINEMDRFNNTACTVCLANGKVWERSANSNSEKELVK